MKIESVEIRNLRSFAAGTVPFNDYSCLVGPNGSGKSTVHCALNIFFRETEGVSTDLSQLDVQDFHLKNTDEPVEVVVTFVELSEEAQADFAGYFRHGKLVVSAVASFDRNTGKAQVKQFGQRLGMSEFAGFFRAEGDGATQTGIRRSRYLRPQGSPSEGPREGPRRSSGSAPGGVPSSAAR